MTRKCKAICQNGKRCPHSASLYGYCIKHYRMKQKMRKHSQHEVKKEYEALSRSALETRSMEE